MLQSNCKQTNNMHWHKSRHRDPSDRIKTQEQHPDVQSHKSGLGAVDIPGEKTGKVEIHTHKTKTNLLPLTVHKHPCQMDQSSQLKT